MSRGYARDYRSGRIHPLEHLHGKHSSHRLRHPRSHGRASAGPRQGHPGGARLWRALELFHALTDAVFIEFGRLDDGSLDRLRERVEDEARIPLVRLCEVARKHGVTASHAVEWDYPAHEAIVRRALATSADLIIAECHRGGRTR